MFANFGETRPKFAELNSGAQENKAYILRCNMSFKAGRTITVRQLPPAIGGV
jgi:hypothetical protein